MTSHKKIINCPNCGAIISRTGRCEYCGTAVRIANHLDIASRNARVELQINIWDGDKVIVVPFTGCLSSMEIEYPRLLVSTFDGAENLVSGQPEVELTFNGYICNAQ